MRNAHIVGEATVGSALAGGEPGCVAQGDGVALGFELADGAIRGALGVELG